MAFLEGEAEKINTGDEIMKVYNAVIFQTDMRGHNKELHEFAK